MSQGIVKLVAAKVNAIAPAVMTPGAISGSVTLKKVRIGLAPITSAASSYTSSVVASDPWIVRTTSGIAPVAVAMTIIGKEPCHDVMYSAIYTPIATAYVI